MRPNHGWSWIHHPQNRGDGVSWSKELAQHPLGSTPLWTCSEVEHSWVFEKLEFLQISMIFKTLGEALRPANVLFKEKKHEVLTRW